MRTLIFFILIIISFNSFGQKHTEKGNKFQENEKFKKAIKHYSKALSNYPKNHTLLFKRARCYRKIGLYDKALTDVNLCLNLDSNCKEGYKEKGAIIAITGHSEESIKFFSKAIEIDPTYAGAYLGRGAAYNLLEEYEKSITDNKKAIELKSNFDGGYYNVGLAYKALGKVDEAIIYFNNAIMIKYDDHQSFFERGLSLYEINEYELAEKDFGNSVIYNTKLDPWEKTDNGWSYYYKGLANIELNNLSQACLDFKSAISFDNSWAIKEYSKLDCKNKEIQISTTLDVKDENETTIDIQIAPNPIVTYAHITITNSHIEDNFSLEIIDITGKSILKIEQISKSYVFNRNNLKSGTYFFTTKTKHQIIKSSKVIIK